MTVQRVPLVSSSQPTRRSPDYMECCRVGGVMVIKRTMACGLWSSTIVYVASNLLRLTQCLFLSVCVALLRQSSFRDADDVLFVLSSNSFKARSACSPISLSSGGWTNYYNLWCIIILWHGKLTNITNPNRLFATHDKVSMKWWCCSDVWIDLRAKIWGDVHFYRFKVAQSTVDRVICLVVPSFKLSAKSSRTFLLAVAKARQ